MTFISCQDKTESKILDINNATMEEKKKGTIMQIVKLKTELSEEEFFQIMNGQKKTFRDFKTYKKRFERLRPFFYILAKKNLVPWSFYIKYCFPLK